MLIFSAYKGSTIVARSSASITVLGSGDTLGTPLMGSKTAANLDDDPKSRRFRFGLLLRLGGVTILVDPNPDLKWQCLQSTFELKEIDHVLITHHHADHTNGMGEFFYRRKQPTKVWYTDHPFNHNHMDYWRYLEREQVLHFATHKNYQAFKLSSDISVMPVALSHGHPASGYVIYYQGKKIAIVTDTNAALPAKTLRELGGADVLFADSFSEDMDQVAELYAEIGLDGSYAHSRPWYHMTISDAMELRRSTGAGILYPIHMSRFMAPHRELVQKYECDEVRIPWDGMQILM